MSGVGLDALPCGVIGYADDGRVVVVNRRLADDLGYAADEILGRQLDALLPPAARLYYSTHVQPTVRLGGRLDEVYLTLRTRTGDLLPVLASARRSEDADAPATILAVLPMHRRAEFEQRLIAARRTAEALLQTRSDLLARRDAEARESARLTEQLRSLAARLERDHSAASRATARSLHEEVAQELAALKWRLDALGQTVPADDLQSQLAALGQLAAQTLAQVRELSYELHPPALEHADLHAAIRAAARAFEEEFGVAVTVTMSRRATGLDREVLLVLYRFVEEALRNSLRHGQASRVTVEIGGTPERVELAVSDDGVGARPESAESADGLGLLAARERLRRLGGSLTIAPRQPTGLTVVAALPVPAQVP